MTVFADRPLRKGDLDAIASFPQSAEELYYVSPWFQYPLTAGQIAALLEGRRAPTVVAEPSTGDVAGYANLYDVADGVCWLGNVIVAPHFRATGAAGVLLEAMKRQAKSTFGAKRLHLSCHQPNARGLAFYRKHGFLPFDLKTVRTADARAVLTFHMGIDL